MPVAGKLSDKFGKKRLLWVGLLIYVIAAVGYLWSPSYQELILFRVFSGAGAAAVFPTAYAYVGELTPRGREGRYMGLLMVSFMVSNGIGPILGGTVHDVFGADVTFASMGVLSAAGMLMVLLLLPGTSPSVEASKSEKTGGGFVAILKDETMRGLITFQLIWGLGYGTVVTFLPVFMTSTLGTSVTQVGMVLSARFLLSGVVAYPFAGWLIG